MSFHRSLFKIERAPRNKQRYFDKYITNIIFHRHLKVVFDIVSCNQHLFTAGYLSLTSFNRSPSCRHVISETRSMCSLDRTSALLHHSPLQANVILILPEIIQNHLPYFNSSSTRVSLLFDFPYHGIPLFNLSEIPQKIR